MAYFLRKIQILRVNNLRIFTIKNAKFSGFYYYMNLNIWGDFQLCISVPLSIFGRCGPFVVHTVFYKNQEYVFYSSVPNCFNFLLESKLAGRSAQT